MVNEQPNAIKEATVAKKVNGKATAEKVVKVTTAKERRQKFVAEHGERVMAKYRELGSALKVEKELHLSPFLVEYVLYTKGGIGTRKDVVTAAKEDGKGKKR